jgi:hypothetical protein
VVGVERKVDEKTIESYCCARYNNSKEAIRNRNLVLDKEMYHEIFYSNPNPMWIF